MSTHTPSDADIIVRSRARPEDFSILYQRRARAVFAYIAARLGAELAEDLTSDTFLVALERLDRYDTARPYALPWLLGIATRLVSKHRRSEASTWQMLARAGSADRIDATAGDRPVDTAQDIDARLDAEAAAKRIAGAVAALPRRDRDVLALTAWTELDSAGIADALGIPEGTVRSRLHRARKTLRTHLEAGGTTTAAPHPLERDHGRTRSITQDTP